ncbi:MAG: A/G-specific adenine glycosylase, partial [Oscillospiraceae bacterium]|nr:A/G-specific adenine glycosylase [Oscillospiraceae bacterium]
MDESLSRLPIPLLRWYAENARDLPWRREPTPYHVWLSEMMLQQTRVQAVLGYYERFLQACPTVAQLAALPEERLLKLWQGLGYYSRARSLQKAANILMERYGGQLPADYQALLDLPGVGAYTAGQVQQ